jgi:hypothetical protein
MHGAKLISMVLVQLDTYPQPRPEGRLLAYYIPVGCLRVTDGSSKLPSIGS